MKYIEYLFLLIIAYVPFLKPYGALDSVYTELFYFSIGLFLITFHIIFFKKTRITQVGISHHLLILFLAWGLLTIYTSFNRVEAIIDWAKFFVFFVSIFYLTSIFKGIKHKSFFYVILILSLSVESVYILLKFINLYEFDNPPSREYQFVGFSSNLNVTAFSILIKIPLLLYVTFCNKNRLISYLATSIYIISSFCLYIIGSRGAIISYLFLTVIFIIVRVFFAKKLKKSIPSTRVYKFALITLLTLATHSFLYQNSENVRVDKRLQSFDLNDQRSSFNFRKGFYEESIKGFMDKPIFGYGIGNWKIFSIDYGKDRIREYQVPYHTHNDILQMLVETGLLGGILYFLILFTPIFFLTKSLITNQKIRVESIFLLASFVIFLLDSSLNFPRARAISMSNFVLLYSYYIVFYEKGKFYSLNSRHLKFVNIITLLLLFFSAGVFYKLYINSVQQLKLIQDFNFTRYFERDLEEIKNISHEFPTLTHTGMPLAVAKANYYAYQGKVDEAKNLFKKGLEQNPFLGSADIGLANIYIQNNQLDSAYFHSRRSLQKLPYNQLHIATHQMVLTKLNNPKYLKEADSIFEIVKKDNVQKIWENHILSIIRYKSSDSFNISDKNLIKEALLKFPTSKKLLTAEKLINNSKDIIVLANDYDMEAIFNFQEGDYKKAIDNWEKAKTLIPNEDSYYLNIAQAYNGLGGYELSIVELNKIEELGIKEENGKLEFLKGVAYLGLEEKSNYCKYFKISAQKGYKLSQETLIKLSCN